jgi:hypothetical protein
MAVKGGASMSWLTFLSPCAGPACPQCGCRDATVTAKPQPGEGVILGPGGAVVKTGVSWRGSGRARCNHCGTVFSFQASDMAEATPGVTTPTPEPITTALPPNATAPMHVQIVPKMQCCKCGEMMNVTSTRKSIRYHKCPSCGTTAKTSK